MSHTHLRRIFLFFRLTTHVATQIIKKTFNRGDTNSFEFIAVNPNDESQVIDLTNAEIWMTAKSSLADDDGDAVFQVTSAAGDIVVNNAGAGRATVTVPPSKTTNLKPFVHWFVYGIQVRTEDAEIFTVQGGPLVIEPDVTVGTVFGVVV